MDFRVSPTSVSWKVDADLMNYLHGSLLVFCDTWQFGWAFRQLVYHVLASKFMPNQVYRANRLTLNQSAQAMALIVFLQHFADYLPECREKWLVLEMYNDLVRIFELENRRAQPKKTTEVC